MLIGIYGAEADRNGAYHKEQRDKSGGMDALQANVFQANVCKVSALQTQTNQVYKHICQRLKGDVYTQQRKYILLEKPCKRGHKQRKSRLIGPYGKIGRVVKIGQARPSI